MPIGHDSVFLVTGSSRGIGHYLADLYADRGFRVIGCSRNPPETTPSYDHVSLDVSDEDAVKRLFSHVRREYGRLDVLINNAGIGAMNHSLLTPISTMRQLLETNVVGTFLFCREAARLMQQKRYGRIVNFTTVAKPLKLEGEAAYAASKAAVETLTHILAREFADLGITVNAIGPTPVETDLIRSVPAEKLDELVKRQAIRRFARFEDISNVIDFFAQEESEFVTGQILYLGGI